MRLRILPSNYDTLYGHWVDGWSGWRRTCNGARSKKIKHAREVSRTAVVLLVTAGIIIMSVVLLFLQPLLILFGATDQDFRIYQWVCWDTAVGIPFFMISGSLIR